MSHRTSKRKLSPQQNRILWTLAVDHECELELIAIANSVATQDAAPVARDDISQFRNDVLVLWDLHLVSLFCQIPSQEKQRPDVTAWLTTRDDVSAAVDCLDLDSDTGLWHQRESAIRGVVYVLATNEGEALYAPS